MLSNDLLFAGALYPFVFFFFLRAAVHVPVRTNCLFPLPAAVAEKQEMCINETRSDATFSRYS